MEMNTNLIPEQEQDQTVSTTDKINIAVMGKGVVGKSSLTFLYLNSSVPKEHDATIEDRYKTTVSVYGNRYSFEIMDTAGEDDYQNMMDNWINFGDGFLLIFAINDSKSFKILQKKFERIRKTKGNENVPVILVGNKKDLEMERTVTYAEAEALARQWGTEYIETSATTKENSRMPFEMIAKKVIDYKYPPVGSDSRKCCCVIF